MEERREVEGEDRRRRDGAIVNSEVLDAELKRANSANGRESAFTVEFPTHPMTHRGRRAQAEKRTTPFARP